MKSKRRWEEATVEGQGEIRERRWDESGKEEWKDKKDNWECGTRGMGGGRPCRIEERAREKKSLRVTVEGG